MDPFFDQDFLVAAVINNKINLLALNCIKVSNVFFFFFISTILACDNNSNHTENQESNSFLL